MQRLGFGGLPGLKRALAAEFSSAVAPDIRLQQRISHVGHDLSDIWARVFDEAFERIETLQAPVRPGGLHPRGLPSWRPRARCSSTAQGPPSPPPATWRSSSAAAATAPGPSSATGFALADELLWLGHGDAVVIFRRRRRLREIEVLIDRARRGRRGRRAGLRTSWGALSPAASRRSFRRPTPQPASPPSR
ncbi:hypothetical protein GCM10020219_066940 [Nonomuraea dietziae]